MDHDPPTEPDPPAWHEQSRLLQRLALEDLRADGDVLPTMVAFEGDRPLFLATLRPFDRGGHHDPIIEVGALGLALRADRVALSLSGRAWSTADPIPPVLPGGPDMRQRVVVIHQVDASVPDPLCLTTVVPVSIGDDGVVDVGPALVDESVRGWVPQALLALAAAGDRAGADDAELAAQVVRCERLGHRVHWSAATLHRVQTARMAALRDDAAGGRSGRRAA